MARLLLLLSLALVSGVLIHRDSPRLKSAPLDWDLIRKELSEVSQTNDDSVTIAGISGNANLTQINSKGDMMFWWFINKIGSNPSSDTAPVIMWLQGGPGCSSMTGNLFEFGPLYIDQTLTPQVRAGSWATRYHLLFVDNPVGAGFSIPGNKSDYVTNQYDMATNLYLLLQNLTSIHPEFFKNHDFYIFGESYAGKYIPSIAYYILNWNGNTTLTHFNSIPLRGIGIGDGITDPSPQVTSYSTYGFATALIDEYEKEMTEVFENQAAQFIQKQNWEQAWDAWNNALGLVITAGGNVNVYNVREFGNYDSSAMDAWLNLTATKQALHVPPSITFLDCGDPAYAALQNDMMMSVANLMPYLLANTRVMLYEGQDDLIINNVGAETWISQLNWYGQTQYLAAPRNIWYNAEAIAGYERGYANLTQVVVLKAGHMVPYDQLANSLDMVTRFITNAGWGNPV